MSDYYGHMTLKDGSHVPLSKEDAEALFTRAEEDKKKRAEFMPTESEALELMSQSVQRLHELGWREAIYCPKDGSIFDAIEAGSTGIHDCIYQGEWPNGHWYILADGDVWPSHPILFKLKTPQTDTASSEGEKS